MKKIFLTGLFLLFCVPCLAGSGLHGAYNNTSFGTHTLRHKPMTNTDITAIPVSQKFPDGMTFYADYSREDIGANWSMGSKLATFTNTSGNVPVITTSGISIGTTRTDVLKYLISENRTAEQETIFIQFIPDTNFANDGVARYLIDNDTKRRIIRKSTTATSVVSLPNATDNGSCNTTATTIPLANVIYVYTNIVSVSSPYTTGYINGSSQGTPDTTDALTANAWGTYWYLGCDYAIGGNDEQFNGYIEKVLIFNHVLSANEVRSVSNLLATN